MMKHKKPIIRYLLPIIILILGITLIYFLKTASLSNIFHSRGTESEDERSSGHQYHTGENPSNQQTITHEEAKEDIPTVEIPLDKQQLIGVKTTEVAVRPLYKIIRTVGKIEYDERKIYTINTKFDGWIEKLYVDFTGRYLKRGEPVAEIYSPELLATQQEYLNALKWAGQLNGYRLYNNDTIKDKNDVLTNMLLQDAKTIIDAARQRLKLWDITDEQIKKIEETGKPIKTLTIFSNVNGYIIQKNAFQGMRVMSGEKLFDVIDLSTVWVVADIYEYELPLIKIGQRANISLSYFPGREYSSTIEYVYPAISGETRTAKVRFTIPNPGGQLKPQMFTNVEIKINIGNKLAIPDDAIIDTGTRQIVYVDKGDGYFEPREVMLGLRAEGFREVIKGLRAGEKVASSATFLIDSEAKLKNVTPLGGN